MNDVEGDPGSATGGAITFRRPTVADHARIAGLVDQWWGGRRVRQTLPRLWLRHFSGTSWLAETPDGRIVGFLVGFISPDHPDTACAHMIATDPNRRRTGLGRALYARFFADASAAGATRVEAVSWPGDPQSIAFHRALGFRVDDGPGTRRIYSTLAYPDYDGDGDDRTVFIREL